MTKRRSRGDGGLHWDEKRQRWIASVTIGYTPAGKRIVRRGSGKTKTEAKDKLKEVLRDHEDGLLIAPGMFTVADAVNDWLMYALSRRSETTRSNYTTLATKHIVKELGARKLRGLCHGRCFRPDTPGRGSGGMGTVSDDIGDRD